MAWFLASHLLYLYRSSFFVVILSLLECMFFCYLKFNVFDKHREKYAKPDFVKFISLEINYFVGTSCFVFKKYRHTFLSGGKSKFPSPTFFFISFIKINTFLSPFARPDIELGKDKVYSIWVELYFIAINIR